MPKLTDLRVKNAKPGVHGDGQGLYLRVAPSGARSWVLRVQHLGKREDIGLGGYPVVDLKRARDRALDLRRAAKDGENARAVRDRAKNRIVIPTFAGAMKATIAKITKGGMVAKNVLAFERSLTTYVLPTIGKRPVNEIGTSDIMTALRPVWNDKPALARKLDIRIRQVLELAIAEQWRSEPAPTRRQLKAGLGSLPQGKHFAAMPYADVPGFVAKLRAEEQTLGRLALLFTIFTGARSGEARLADWSQVDLDARIWTRPAEIMKNRKEHVVTLNPEALAILAKAKENWGGDGLVFPASRGKPLSDATLTKVLRDAGVTKDEATVHGFRSSFRDWAAERTNYPREIAEAAIAHIDGNQVERAYRRTDYLEKRRPLLDAWGRFIAPSSSTANSNEISGEAQAAA